MIEFNGGNCLGSNYKFHVQPSVFDDATKKAFANAINGVLSEKGCSEITEDDIERYGDSTEDKIRYGFEDSWC